MFRFRLQTKGAKVIGVLAAGCVATAGLQLGVAGAATTRPAAVAPRLVAHRTVETFVSDVAPTSARFAATATRVPAGIAPKLSCGQYLTVDETAAWSVFGSQVMYLKSTDYTKWCSGHAYTSSYSYSCKNLNVLGEGFTCLGGATTGVIGQGSSEVNPWYDQPVRLSIWSGTWTYEYGTGYGRNYLQSNGKSTEWFKLTW